MDFGQSCGELNLNQEARQEWERIYFHLTTIELGGILNSMFARAETYVLMLASIFAVLDCRRVVEPKDLKAGLAWIEYWRRSLVFIFVGERKRVEAEKDKEEAEEILQAIRTINDGKGCKQTEINRYFNSHKSSTDMTSALERLLSEVPPRVTMERKKGRGRPAKIYKPA